MAKYAYKLMYSLTFLYVIYKVRVHLILTVSNLYILRSVCHLFIQGTLCGVSLLVCVCVHMYIYWQMPLEGQFPTYLVEFHRIRDRSGIWNCCPPTLENHCWRSEIPFISRAPWSTLGFPRRCRQLDCHWKSANGWYWKSHRIMEVHQDF